MGKFTPIILLSLIVFSCSPRMSNFIKQNYPEDKKSLFSQNDVIYYINLDTSSVSFHMAESSFFDNLFNINTIKEVDLEKYVLTEKTDSSLISEFYDAYGLIDEKNYSHKSPKHYFTKEYNNTFMKVMQGESLRMTKYAPKKLNVLSVDINTYKDFIIRKQIYSPIDSLEVTVYEPKDIKTFCNQFKKEYPNANYIILTGNLYITKNIFEKIRNYKNYDPFTGLTSMTSSKPDGFIISSKVVIDVNNELLSGYHIGRNPVSSSLVHSIKSAIESAFVYDVMELNLYY